MAKNKNSLKKNLFYVQLWQAQASYISHSFHQKRTKQVISQLVDVKSSTRWFEEKMKISQLATTWHLKHTMLQAIHAVPFHHSGKKRKQIWWNRNNINNENHNSGNSLNCSVWFLHRCWRLHTTQHFNHNYAVKNPVLLVQKRINVSTTCSQNSYPSLHMQSKCPRSVSLALARSHSQNCGYTSFDLYFVNPLACSEHVRYLKSSNKKPSFLDVQHSLYPNSSECQQRKVTFEAGFRSFQLAVKIIDPPCPRPKVVCVPLPQRQRA